MKQCEEHSGIEARVTALEKTCEEIRKDIKDMSAKLNKYAGAIGILAAIPVIWKIIEIFTPIAKAME